MEGALCCVDARKHGQTRYCVKGYATGMAGFSSNLAVLKCYEFISIIVIFRRVARLASFVVMYFIQPCCGRCFFSDVINSSFINMDKAI